MITLLNGGFTLIGVVCVGVLEKPLLACCIVRLHVLQSGALGAFGVQWVLPATDADL
jgi:hypothetical protein